MVTHYAEPIGYIFGRDHLSSARRSHAPGRARSAPARQPVGRVYCPSIPGFPSGHFQAPALAAPSSSGAGAERGKAQVLSVKPGAAESSRSLVRVVPRLLEHEPGELESVRRSGACERNDGGRASEQSPKNQEVLNLRREDYAIAANFVLDRIDAVGPVGTSPNKCPEGIRKPEDSGWHVGRKRPLGGKCEGLLSLNFKPLCADERNYGQGRHDYDVPLGRGSPFDDTLLRRRKSAPHESDRFSGWQDDHLQFSGCD